MTHMDIGRLQKQRAGRASAIAASGGVDAAIASNRIPVRADLTLSECVLLGLLKQDVRTFFVVFGHGSTDIGEVLRIYHQHKLVKVLNVRSEIEASHAASALRWVTGEKSAVVTSIGPGAMQALAASLVAASDGLGVWYIFGDETTEDEGLNMQQIPRSEQASFLKLFSAAGAAYSLHTPLAVSAALRRGQAVVDHPYRAGPFYLLMPMNTQPCLMERFNLSELPSRASVRIGAAEGDYEMAADWIERAKKVVVRVGGGAAGASSELLPLLELSDGVAIVSPMASGVIPYSHPRNMTVAGSKGSLCGNYAMENADLLIAVGSRFVCQSDCSRTGYLNVRRVININADMEAALHYNNTLPLAGDACLTVRRLVHALRRHGVKSPGRKSSWYSACIRQRKAWEEFKLRRYSNPVLYDTAWKKKVLTQPAAIRTAAVWAAKNGAVKFFDAGDVQANGFQIVEDEKPGFTFTETGASYMGFAASALLASAAAGRKFFALAFTGDGSFTMNPQILIDGVQHGAHGCILLLDNRRMAAISGLQLAQYKHDFATCDSVETDYVAWAKSIKGVLALQGGSTRDELIKALDRARRYDGLSLVHVPVYFGPDELGGMGVFGRWNVGNWCESTQALRHSLDL